MRRDQCPRTTRCQETCKERIGTCRNTQRGRPYSEAAWQAEGGSPAAFSSAPRGKWHEDGTLERCVGIVNTGVSVWRLPSVSVSLANDCSASRRQKRPRWHVLHFVPRLSDNIFSRSPVHIGKYRGYGVDHQLHDVVS
jgi:hypothetical protein